MAKRLAQFRNIVFVSMTVSSKFIPDGCRCIGKSNVTRLEKTTIFLLNDPNFTQGLRVSIDIFIWFFTLPILMFSDAPVFPQRQFRVHLRRRPYYLISVIHIRKAADLTFYLRMTYNLFRRRRRRSHPIDHQIRYKIAHSLIIFILDF